MSKMVNLEQKRALNAFEACINSSFSGVAQGEVVKKLPPMIRNNGMLGALAFALSKGDKKDGEGFVKAFEAIMKHLKSIDKVNASNVNDFQSELINCPALKLRDVTAETMLYLDYLRRFAKKDKPREKQ